MKPINLKDMSDSTFRLVLALSAILFVQLTANAQNAPLEEACAVENKVCSFEGERSVIYGANGKFITKRLRGNSLCGAASFDGRDPAPNVVKTCYLVTPNLTGQWTYHDAQGRQLSTWDFVQSGSTFSMLNIDGIAKLKFNGRVAAGKIVGGASDGVVSFDGTRITEARGGYYRRAASTFRIVDAYIFVEKSGDGSTDPAIFGSVTLRVLRGESEEVGRWALFARTDAAGSRVSLAEGKQAKLDKIGSTFDIPAGQESSYNVALDYDLKDYDASSSNDNLGATTRVVNLAKFLQGGVIGDTLTGEGTVKLAVRIAEKNVKPIILTAPRFSYDDVPYIYEPAADDSGNHYKWNGGKERTIYNPLDGGILMKYSFTSQGRADGCSAGTSDLKQFFFKACMGHDTNYDAPLNYTFPKYPDGKSIGQDLADFLFYQDMKLISENAGKGFVGDAFAYAFYRGVSDWASGSYRGGRAGTAVSSENTGGVIAIQNKMVGTTINLVVNWTGPDGTPRSFEDNTAAGRTLVVPLSIGATDIKFECKAVAGTSIFSRNVGSTGMYAYTVTGTTLIHSMKDGLQSNR